MIETMSRCDRLERWAAVLESADRPALTPFRDVEFMSAAARDRLQTANSPLAVAYEDPVLRRAGLASDRFGDGAAFFDLTRFQAHRVLCSCGYVGRMRPGEVARRVRRIAARERLRQQFPGRQLPAFARWLLGWRPPLADQRG